MGTEDIIRTQVAAFNRHDAVAFAACYAANAVVADPQSPDPLKGTEAITKDIDDWFGAFPDIETRMTRTVLNGAAYAVEWSMTGTHEGPLVTPDGHIPATGKPVRINVATIGRTDAAGRIVEERRYYDLSSVMSQLGLIQ
ncbi:MAG TPA: ester cyclase [Bauldia sp.]|nr:ester cyclase [Bauldia sp.]